MANRTENTHRPTVATDKLQVTVAEAMARLPGPEGERFASVLEHGSLVVEIYAPRGHDPQTPHTRDEVYVVVQGEGFFVIQNTLNT